MQIFIQFLVFIVIEKNFEIFLTANSDVITVLRADIEVFF